MASLGPLGTRPGRSEQVKKGRPCDACRRRKSKCVVEDENSACVLCKFHSQSCTYLEDPRPRRRRSTPACSPQERNKRLRLRSGTGIEEYDNIPGPTLLKRTLGLQNLHHSQYVGASDVLDVYNPTAIGNFTDPTTTDHGSIKEVVRSVHVLHAFRIIPDASTINYERETALVDEIESTVGSSGPDLVQLYFRIIHPSFPILHQEVYLEKYARSHREFSPPLLAAVYLLASGYWSYSDRLARVPKPDLSRLLRLAYVSLQSAAKRPKLSTIQAGLLLSQYDTPSGVILGYSSHYALTAQLIELAYGLGLHLDASDWDIPPWEVQLRRRLAWALYMQDKWTALLDGRPSLINRDDWDVRPLHTDDFPENDEDDQAGSSEVEKGRLVFMHMAILSVIVSDILLAIFSARARRSVLDSVNKLGTILECMKPSQIRLKDCSTNLPDSLRMDTAASMKLSAVGYLRLSYLAVEVCMHRQLIKTITGSTPSLASQQISSICQDAARERFDNAVDFIQQLQAKHLASFWYFVSAKCCSLIYSFGRALETTARSAEESQSFNRKLKQLRWGLKVNSEAGAGFMKTALVSIERSAAILHFDPTTRSSTATSPAEWPHVSLPGSTTPKNRDGGLATSPVFWDAANTGGIYDDTQSVIQHYDYSFPSPGLIQDGTFDSALFQSEVAEMNSGESHWLT